MIRSPLDFDGSNTTFDNNSLTERIVSEWFSFMAWVAVLYNMRHQFDYFDTLSSKTFIYERTGLLLHIKTWVFTDSAIYDLHVRQLL